MFYKQKSLKARSTAFVDSSPKNTFPGKHARTLSKRYQLNQIEKRSNVQIQCLPAFIPYSMIEMIADRFLFAKQTFFAPNPVSVGGCTHTNLLLSLSV